MPKSITVRKPDGSPYTYKNVPDNVTQEEAQARANREFSVQSETVDKTPDVTVTKIGDREITQPQQPESSGFMRGLGLVGRAVAPYAAAAGTGAAAGAPFAGVGAIPGAIAGVTAYTAAQLADALLMGGRGQEAIERGLTAAGLPEPSNAMENVGIAGIRGMMGGGALASQAQRYANTLRATLPAAPNLQLSPLTARERIFDIMGKRPDVQMVAGGLGASGSQAAREVGLPEPIPTLVGVGTSALPYASVGGMQRGLQTAAETIRGVPSQVRQAVSQVRGTSPPPPPPPATTTMLPNKVRADNVSRLEREGIPVSPGQRSGAPLTQTMESTMAYLPGSTGQAAKFQDLQHRAFTQALLRHAGIESDVASPEVLRAAQEKFGQRYADLESQTVLTSGSNKLFNELAKIETEYGRGFSSQMRKQFLTIRDDLLNWSAGTPRPGQNFQRMQEELSAEISKAARSDAPGSERYRQAMQGLRRALFDLMEQNTPPKIAQQWREINRQYAIFKTIEESMLDPSQQTLNTNFINPKVVAREQKSALPSEWTRGDPTIDSFTNLVKAGAALIPDPIPNSGTAQRMLAQDLLTGGGQMFGLTGGGTGLQRLGQFARGGVGTAASVTAVDPVLGLGVPNLVSRTWYRQPQPSTPVAAPSAIQSQTQRQKTRRERMADALSRSQ